MSSRLDDSTNGCFFRLDLRKVFSHTNDLDLRVLHPPLQWGKRVHGRISMIQHDTHVDRTWMILIRPNMERMCED